MSTIREGLARWLAPEMAADADALYRLRHDIADGRWWLGTEFPDHAMMAEWLLRRLVWWRRSKRPEPTDELTAWAPPYWVLSIDELREWLRKRALPNQTDSDGERG